MNQTPMQIFARKILLWERGSMLPSEFADVFLMSPVDDTNVGSYAECFDQFPRPLRTAILDRIKNLRGDDFSWEPFFIGGRPTREYCQRLQDQVRLLVGAIANVSSEALTAGLADSAAECGGSADVMDAGRLISRIVPPALPMTSIMISIDGHELPARLYRLLVNNQWRLPKDKNRWLSLIPSEHIVQPSLYPLDKLDGRSLWSSEAGDDFVGVVDENILPGMLDPLNTIIIGDLGPERLLALDLRVSKTNPPVCAFLPRDDNYSCWKVIAESLDQFILSLGLEVDGRSE